ncbi:nitronate monooxygenase [Mesobacillus foraminis]|uniref:NAD(P)H-dependent flavin oxidoreductase n=1 Tax=Mesobacillus foraminis TaxID=279826 RepID=UPI0039A2C655
MKHTVTELLNIDFPILQAPMAGGITTPELVAAVSNHGGLGMIGAGYLDPNQLRKQINEVRQLTDKAFGVNLFIPNTFTYDSQEAYGANQSLHSIRKYLNISDPEPPNITYNDSLKSYQEQLRILIEEKVSVCSFTFGLPSDKEIEKLKRHNMILIGTATTVEEAVKIQNIGMDFAVVQGSEAGGHRGTFLNVTSDRSAGLFSLLPQAVDHLHIPVIAAGGIMDGRGLVAAISLGAQAVQMGTAFLTCKESGAPKVHKAAILHATEEDAILTRTFSGKWARGLKNDFISQMSKHEGALPPYPVQHLLTQDIRKAAAAQNNPEYMSLWSGQSPTLAKAHTVKKLIEEVMREAKKIQDAIHQHAF